MRVPSQASEGGGSCWWLLELQHTQRANLHTTELIFGATRGTMEVVVLPSRLPDSLRVVVGR